MPSCCSSCATGKECDSSNLMKPRVDDIFSVALGFIALDWQTNGGFAASTTGMKAVAGAAGYAAVKGGLKVKKLHDQLEALTAPHRLMSFEIVYLGMRLMGYTPTPSLLSAGLLTAALGYFFPTPKAKNTVGLFQNKDQKGPHSVANFQVNGGRQSARRGVRAMNEMPF